MWLKNYSLTSAGEDVEKLKPSYTADGNVKWCSCFRKWLAVPQKFKHVIIVWPSNSTPSYVCLCMYISKRNENTCPYKNLYMNVHKLLFTMIPKWKYSKCSSTDEWINKMWSIHIKVHILLGCEKEKSTDTGYNMNFEKLCQVKETSHNRSHIIWFHVYEMSRISKSIETERLVIV